MTVRARSSAIVETPSRETLPLPVTGLILCGGQSRRMGTSKSFLPYEGSTFVEHRLKSLRALFAEVFLVTNTPDQYDSLGVGIIKDIVPQRGPLVGILSGLLVSQFDHSFVIACDMPLVDNKLIRSLCATRKGRDAVVLNHDEGSEPLLGVYSRQIIPALEEFVFAGNSKVQDFLATIDCGHYQHAGNARELPSHFNVNTPQDYAQVVAQ